MTRSTRFTAALLGALLSCVAQAANLTALPAPTLTPAEQTAFNSVAARGDITGAPVAYAFSAAALDSTTVSVALAGTSYALVGVKTNDADVPNVDIWKGAVGGVTGLFGRYNGRVLGRMRVGTKRYEVIQLGTGVGVVVQIKPAESFD